MHVTFQCDYPATFQLPYLNWLIKCVCVCVSLGVWCVSVAAGEIFWGGGGAVGRRGLNSTQQ